MEHREPPRIGAGDRLSGATVENGASGVRLCAFDPFRGRARVDPVRVGATVLGLIVVAAMAVYGLSRATMPPSHGFIANRTTGLRSRTSSWIASCRSGIAGENGNFSPACKGVREARNLFHCLEFGLSGSRPRSSSTRGSRR